MNKTFLVILLVVAFALPGHAQTPCTRYVAADFSICQPAGWTANAKEGDVFKTISGTASNGKMANLVFSEDANSLKLGEYVDATNNYALKHVADLGFTSLKLIGRSAVVTDTNEAGIKSIFLEELSGNKLCGMQYIFDTGKKKLLVTFTSFESERVANEKLFDETVKSLRIDH